jgi:hypothetical protein
MRLLSLILLALALPTSVHADAPTAPATLNSTKVTTTPNMWSMKFESEDKDSQDAFMALVKEKKLSWEINESFGKWVLEVKPFRGPDLVGGNETKAMLAPFLALAEKLKGELNVSASKTFAETL